ncbi:MAG: hypothetical protein KGY70_04415 [Bacteroidales bacterium]|nr:hypothetical protein [Bacteroidales bacterium]
MKHILYIGIIFFSLFISCTSNKEKQDDSRVKIISKEFRNPPVKARPGAFWCWLNGNISRKSITRDLREMNDKGMRRAEIWDVAAVNNPDNYIPAGPAFMSDSSVAMIKHALKEGKKYDIEIGMVGSSGWNAGGPWVTLRFASKALFYSERFIKGPVKKTIELPFPEVPDKCPKDKEGMPVYYKEVAVLAIPYNNQEKTLSNTESIIDLTSQFSDGQLKADLPKGNWLLMRFVSSNTGQKLIVPSPNSGGLFIDFLDPDATKKHLMHFIKRLGIKKGKSKGEGGLAYIEFDSMELDEGTPWTHSMPEIFKKRRGYELIKYLPVLAGWRIEDQTEKFLYDWEKTISDRLIFSHYTTGRKLLKKYNIDLVAEAGGPGPPVWDTCPVDALKALGNVTIPRGEFWIQHRHIFLVKEIASAAHIYGKDIVDAESFTTWRRWKDTPYSLKPIVDRAFCEGLNRVTFHTFANTNPKDSLPGRTYHAGVDINPAVTWWEKSKPFMDYLSRCSYILQKGSFVADACYFYGDQAPNFYPAHHVVPEKPLLDGLDEGYDYDVVNTDVILNRMSVENNKIVLPDGLSYSVMVLPDQNHMPPEVLQKLEKMVREGATIIGKKPVTVPGLDEHARGNTELSNIADKMWTGLDGEDVKTNHYGKGRVIHGLSATEVLLNDGIIRDFSHTKSPDLDFIHRQFEDGDAYFIRNKTEQTFSGECSFRVTGMYSELWDPSTGKQTRITDFSEKEGMTTMNLDLPPHGTVFVVFTDNKRTSQPTRDRIALDIASKQKIEGPWKVTFPEGWGAPAETTFDSLISWTDSDIQGIRYFSGTTTYHKNISIPEEAISNNDEIYISLGKVCDVAEVYVNGTSAGILWKKPFRTDISDLVEPGTNQLKIEVVNCWVNRLTGDMRSKPENRFCRTNQPYITSDDMGFDNWAEGGNETFRLQTSGLLGPVNILYSKN